MAGRKKMMEVWPACLTVGASFSITQLLVSNLHGPWVVGIAAGFVSALSLVILLRFWQPKTTWSFEHEAPGRVEAAAAADPRHSPRAALLAWMPWILLSVLVFTWGLPPMKDFLNGGACRRSRTSSMAAPRVISTSCTALRCSSTTFQSWTKPWCGPRRWSPRPHPSRRSSSSIRFRPPAPACSWRAYSADCCWASLPLPCCASGGAPCAGFAFRC